MRIGRRGGMKQPSFSIYEKLQDPYLPYLATDSEIKSERTGTEKITGMTGTTNSRVKSRADRKGVAGQ